MSERDTRDQLIEHLHERVEWLVSLYHNEQRKAQAYKEEVAYQRGQVTRHLETLDQLRKDAVKPCPA